MSSATLTEGLNPAQIDAVTHRGGPILVVAGAGSGKTRVLTHRIAYLIDHCGVSPFAVLAITFTNKAAQEMKHRVGALVGPVADKMWVSTFHSACARILRYEAEAIDYPSTFTIYDQADAVRLTGYICRDFNLDPKRMPPRSVHAAISAAKNEMLGVAQYKDAAANVFERRIGDIYEEYQARLRRAGAMDFDDLLGATVELFRQEPAVLDRYRRRFEHVLVDEYQDTNRVQNELVLMLGHEHRNVFVVGDADQSVYRFRGADIRNINDFERAFEDVTVVLLEQNYRSTQRILSAANAVITNNLGRKPKNLWTERSSGEPVVRYCAADEYEEARWVVSEAYRLHDDEQHRWDEIAVFYRTNAQSRVVEEVLVEAGIPYQLIGGTRFYDRREVKDALAYLRVTVNPSDTVSLRRALNTPKRGGGRRVGGQAGVLGRRPRPGPDGRPAAGRRRGGERSGVGRGPELPGGDRRRPRPVGRGTGAGPGAHLGHQRLRDPARGRGHRRDRGERAGPGAVGEPRRADHGGRRDRRRG